MHVITHKMHPQEKKMATDAFTYIKLLAHENVNNAHKNVQKSSNISKPSIHYVVSTGTNVLKIWLPLYFVGCVRFAWYCGKMYSRHLFPTDGGGLRYFYK